jgi:hypothetical protein
MKKFCPISSKKVDENVTRITASFSILVLLLFIFTPQKWLIVLLFTDYFIRGFIESKYSLLYIISRKLTNVFNMKPNMINAGPKIFAAQVGFFFSLLIGIFHVLNMPIAVYTTASILLICAFLEVSIALCVACKIYPIIQHRK